MSDVIRAPWTEEQVKELKRYQAAGVVHPYTCGGDSCRDILVPTTDGWTCPSCDYTQDWAHAMSADSQFNDNTEKIEELMSEALKQSTMDDNDSKD